MSEKQHKEQMAALAQIVTELGLVSRLLMEDMIYRYDSSPLMLEKIREHGEWFRAETQTNMAMIGESE